MSRGFTLIEILVVLAVMGLLTSIAVPAMQRMAEGYEISTQRAQLLADLNGMSYRAYANGKRVVLTDQDSKGSQALIIPPGWRIQTDKPIVYNFNGLCDGGKLTLIAPDNHEEALQLEPPRCQIAATP